MVEMKFIARPEWQPFMNLSEQQPHSSPSFLTFMRGSVHEDRCVYLYKNYLTRHYLNVDIYGTCRETEHPALLLDDVLGQHGKTPEEAQGALLPLLIRSLQ